MRDRNRTQPATCLATSRGIAQCLRMLAEEAGSLNLTGTMMAIWSAIETCEHESSSSTVLPLKEVVRPGVTPFN
ncbi:MAG: hypothetical protein ACREFJ_01610 [Acetobacteraceae bacterium]